MKKTTKSRSKIKPSKFKIDEISLVLIVAIIIIAMTISQKTNHEKDTGNIMRMILNDNSATLSANGVIDQAELEKIQNMDYEQLKKYLNMKKDFCLYVEDENGNIIMSKGSSKLSRDGIYCKE